jgi:DNA-binding CsgD family transcriptional regulator
MGSRKLRASSDSVAAIARRPPALAPPEDLSVLRFTVGSEEYALLTFVTRDIRVDRQSLERLTETERTILRLVVQGHSNSEIARARGTSASTVANQLYIIYRKLGVSSRRELLAQQDSGPSLGHDGSDRDL